MLIELLANHPNPHGVVSALALCAIVALMIAAWFVWAAIVVGQHVMNRNGAWSTRAYRHNRYHRLNQRR